MFSEKNIARLKIIGRIHTPFKDIDAIPIQGTANTARGTIALAEKTYGQALDDLDGFDRVWLLYVALNGGDWEPKIMPKLDTTPRGVFATRSMLRPNPLGMTCVKLVRVEHHTIHIEGVDMLDGSPLLDIKPYVPRFDSFPDSWSGWLEHSIPHQNAWRDPDAGKGR